MEVSEVIYTLGTSTRKPAEFFSLIEIYGIKGIVDVRRFPQSKRFPHFNKDNIKKESERLGISYYWLGDLLGGFRTGGYESYKKEASYLKGLKKVESMAKESVIVLICAERLPRKCHRFQIAKSLKVHGWEVIHIIDEGHTWQLSE
ncbi:MAG: DUF488 domain-containing protein [Deltaproteobacteria bacterium]|nr:DUF488 domain-containing protein [Deltaproteobacteria bacterium]MBW2114796.1 DUF488 domain-containing protein [Deltaproteobacteria bacterium]